MNPLSKTLFMIVVAAALTAGASYYYPWASSEVISSKVGEPLFDDYQPEEVKRITLQRYNKQSNRLQTIKLRRKGDRWLLPDKDNFEATNTSQIARTTNSLLQRDVLDEVSDQEAKHVDFGVVDPALHETTANKSALGMKLVLEKSSGQPIASIIVGKLVEGQANRGGPGKYFVSVPGQPNVYELNVDLRAMQTSLAGWIEPNVFSISNAVEFELFFDKPNSDDQTTGVGYQLQFDPTTIVKQDGSLNFEIAKRRTTGGELVDANLANVGPIKPDAQPPSSGSPLPKIGRMFSQLQQPVFADVFRKPNSVGKALESISDTSSAADFKKLIPFGFEFVSADKTAVDFSSPGGSAGVKFSTGLVIRLYFGALIDDSDNVLSVPARYAMIIAHVDPSLMPQPIEPEAAQDAEQAEKEKKAYLLAVQERETTLASARASAADFNRRHGDWIYSIPEQAVEFILPELEFETP